MNQKNRLLREALLMLTFIGNGQTRPLRSEEERVMVMQLRDRIAKNLNITPEATV